MGSSLKGVKRVYLAGPPFADEYRSRAAALVAAADLDSRHRTRGTAMEAWYAHSRGIPVVGYTGGTPAHPWAVYVTRSLHAQLEEAIAAL
jgi:nucleoside 2-deoxyribosyltransferase